MTDAKPDPLEDLRQLARELESATCATDAERIDASIAAWEKERARLMELEQVLGHPATTGWAAQVQTERDLLRLRAAVEKVRDEAYKEAKLSANGSLFRWIGDALDSALGGGV